jgi:hypothetical protein
MNKITKGNVSVSFTPGDLTEAKLDRMTIDQLLLLAQNKRSQSRPFKECLVRHIYHLDWLNHFH